MFLFVFGKINEQFISLSVDIFIWNIYQYYKFFRVNTTCRCNNNKWPLCTSLLFRPSSFLSRLIPFHPVFLSTRFSFFPFFSSSPCLFPSSFPFSLSFFQLLPSSLFPFFFHYFFLYPFLFPLSSSSIGFFFFSLSLLFFLRLTPPNHICFWFLRAIAECFTRLSHGLGVCPPVCPFVTPWHCIKTATPRITKSLPSVVLMSLVICDRISCPWVRGFPSN